MQAQDPRARLAVRARSEGLTTADVDRALTGDRALLITWLNRGTLHLVRSEDYPWLHALTTPPLQTVNARRLAQEGVSPAAAERGVETIERSLADEGPLTRAQLAERLERADVPTAGQALVHLLLLSSLRGLTIRGPIVGPHHAHVLFAIGWGKRRSSTATTRWPSSRAGISPVTALLMIATSRAGPVSRSGTPARA